METYQKSVQDVDIALRRLNATLESYRLSSATKQATTAFLETSGPAAPAASASRKAAQSIASARSAERLAERPKAVVNPTDTLREREQQTHDSVWQNVLDLRYVLSKSNRDQPIRAVSSL
jgi:hypothetical protein